MCREVSLALVALVALAVLLVLCLVDHGPILGTQALSRFPDQVALVDLVVFIHMEFPDTWHLCQLQVPRDLGRCPV